MSLTWGHWPKYLPKGHFYISSYQLFIKCSRLGWKGLTLQISHLFSDLSFALYLKMLNVASVAAWLCHDMSESQKQQTKMQLWATSRSFRINWTNVMHQEFIILFSVFFTYSWYEHAFVYKFQLDCKHYSNSQVFGVKSCILNCGELWDCVNRVVPLYVLHKKAYTYSPICIRSF